MQAPARDASTVYVRRVLAWRAWSSVIRGGGTYETAAAAADTALGLEAPSRVGGSAERAPPDGTADTATRDGGAEFAAVLARACLPDFPPPLCASDGGFTAASLLERLPAILESTLAASAAPAALAAAVRHALIAPLARGELLPPPPAAAAADAACVDGAGDRAWRDAALATPPRCWWWQETVAYAHLRALWAAAGLAAEDPFAAQKRAALAAAEPAWAAALAPLAAAPPSRGALRGALFASLWGNRADLSLSAGRVDAVAPAGGAAELLADDSEAALALLDAAHGGGGGGGAVALVLDNCGLELLADLVLADALLRGGWRVTLWAKAAPTFVSDATAADVAAHVAWAAARAPALGARLAAARAAGELAVTEDACFADSPRAGWDLPPRLLAALAPCALAVWKGDANYRRLLGDRHWPHDEPFQRIVGAYAPCPFLALRTCKAGLLAGVDAAASARARAAQPGDWLVSGRFAVVQLALPAVQEAQGS